MECWYCKQNTMLPWEDLGKGWCKCSSCGATHQSEPTGKKKKRKEVKT